MTMRWSKNDEVTKTQEECSAHHPPNEIILSDVVPRWAVIGWLLTTFRRKNYVDANAELMKIEPAILLTVHSISQYFDMSHDQQYSS
ncbi:integrator complex subunit 3 [Medicago truncatula]|uniref:Integrator complex subunit 3 n=1 Tax=Medicago truncatula TaxID=3880 RepID=G7JKH6_MEDTR|nr:integrator complex subunit 3 [Medicago truncatula]